MAPKDRGSLRLTQAQRECLDHAVSLLEDSGDTKGLLELVDDDPYLLAAVIQHALADESADP